MYRNFAILLLRALALYVFMNLVGQMPNIYGYIQGALVSENSLAIRYMTGLIISDALLLIVSLVLWFKADKIANHLLKGVVEGDSSKENVQDFSPAVLCAAGFLILTFSFQPLAAAVYHILTHVETGKRFTEWEYAFKGFACFFLGLFLIAKPAQIWRGIIKLRTV